MYKKYVDLGERVLIIDDKGNIQEENAEPHLNEKLQIQNRLENINKEILTNIQSMDRCRLYYTLGTWIQIVCGVFSLICGVALFISDSVVMAIISMIFCNGWGAMLGCAFKKDMQEEYQGYDYKQKLAEEKKAALEQELEELKQNQEVIENNPVLKEPMNKTYFIHSLNEDEENMSQELERVYQYGKMMKKLQKMQQKGRLDEYFTKLGCSEEDKAFYLSMLAEEQQEQSEGKILVKK